MEYFADTAKFNIIPRLVAKNNVNNNEIKGIAVISAQKFAASPYWVRDLTELRFPLYRVSLFLLTMIKTNPREKRRPRVESANVWWRIKSLFEFKSFEKVNCVVKIDYRGNSIDDVDFCPFYEGIFH